MLLRCHKWKPASCQDRCFQWKFGDLRQDVNDHERRLSALNFDLLKQDSPLKGYKDTNDKLVATLRMDVNDTRVKIPELRREIQDSTVGLVTSNGMVQANVGQKVTFLTSS